MEHDDKDECGLTPEEHWLFPSQLLTFEKENGYGCGTAGSHVFHMGHYPDFIPTPAQTQEELPVGIDPRVSTQVHGIDHRDVDVPARYHDIKANKHAKLWYDASELEWAQLWDFASFEWIREDSLPPGAQVLGTRFHYGIKPDKFKARLVVQGFQQSGLTGSDVYSPTLPLSLVRLVVGMTVQKGWELRSFDISNAFLQANCREENLYVRPPPGHFRRPGYVLKLHKMVYGLKRAPQAFFDDLSGTMASLDMNQSDLEPCFFYNNSVICGCHVDDALYGGLPEDLDRFEAGMKSKYKVKCYGPKPKDFVGLEFKYLPDGGIIMHQKRYIEAVAKRYGIDKLHPKWTPMSADAEIVSRSDEEECGNQDYFEMIGSARYAFMGTRMDIGPALAKLSCHMQNPSKVHRDMVIRMLTYLYSTRELGIKFVKREGGPSLLEFEALCDSDWAGDKSDRRSLAGKMVLLNGTPISWSSGKLKAVCLSSTEAEFRVASMVVTDLLYIAHLMQELGVYLSNLPVYIDNKSAIDQIKTSKVNPASKHVETRYYHVKSEYKKGFIVPIWIPTSIQLSDFLTKALPRPHFEFLRKFLMTDGVDTESFMELLLKHKSVERAVNLLMLGYQEDEHNALTISVGAVGVEDLESIDAGEARRAELEMLKVIDDVEWLAGETRYVVDREEAEGADCFRRGEAQAGMACRMNGD
jgi:hypothetical protein